MRPTSRARLLAATILATSVLAGPEPVSAQPEPATISPGGALDIRLRGFMRFGVEFGKPDGSDLRDLRFITDSEVHFSATGKYEPWSLSYGAAVEFEADESATRNVDETSIFFEGGWGRMVAGDNDSGTLEIGGLSSYNGTVFEGYYGGVGAQTVAAGSGGIDGDLSTMNPDGYVYSTFDSSDATKIRYDSRVLGSPDAGLVVSVAFTPDTGARGSSDGNVDDNGDFENVVEAGALYGLAWDGGKAILGGTLSLGGEEDNAEAGTSGDDFFDWGVGGQVFFGSLGLAAGVGQNESIDADWYSIGVGYRTDLFNVSLNYGLADGDDVSPSELIGSLDFGLMPGVVVQGDIGWVDPDETDGFLTGLVRTMVSF